MNKKQLIVAWVMVIFILNGCATTITQPASFKNIPSNIHKVEPSQSLNISVLPFDFSVIPNEVGDFKGGNLFKEKFATVKIENKEETAFSLAKAFIMLLRNSGYAVLNEPISRENLSSYPADIILEAKVVSFSENVDSDYITFKNRYSITCQLMFDLVVKNIVTGEVLSTKRCEGYGSAVCSDMRALRYREDSGSVNWSTLVMRELDETGYFKKAEAIALIKAMESVFNDPNFVDLLLRKN